MKLSNRHEIYLWIMLLVIAGFLLFSAYPRISNGTATTADISIFLILIAIGLLPLLDELSLFGITFKKEVEKLKSEITTQFDNLKTEIRNTINLQVNIPSEGQIPSNTEEKTPKRNSMEFKILNTLWTKQVNKFPTFSTLFTFVISQNTPEYLQFREAGSKLFGEGLVGETDAGQYHLTHKGWEWCKEHYRGL